MPTTIIPPFTPPIPRFTPSTGQIVGPADGDPLISASVNDAFYQLADRTTLAFDGLYGVSGSRMVASCTDGNLILINEQAAVRSNSGVLSGSLSPINILTVLGGAPSANTWYYVYGADVSGVLTAVISTDAPDATLKYRTGNADHVFLTMFRAATAGAVRSFNHYEGFYSYCGEVSVISRSDPGNVVTAAAIPDVPPFARQAFISPTIYGLDPLQTSSYRFMYPGLTAEYKEISVGDNSAGAGDVRNSRPMLLPIDGQTGFEYIRPVGSGTADISAILDGIPL